jgi:hypothetical protein
VFRLTVPADDELSTNENKYVEDSENVESADEQEEQEEEDGKEIGEEVTDDSDGEEEEDAEDIATEAEAEAEDNGDQYVDVVLSVLLLIFFVLGSRTWCIWRIWKKLSRTFVFLAIVSFNV